MNSDDINYGGQYLDNKEFRLKIRTGEDIGKVVNNAICGEMFLQIIEEPYSIELIEDAVQPEITLTDTDALASDSEWTISFWVKIIAPDAGSSDFSTYFNGNGSHFFRIYKGTTGHYITLRQGGLSVVQAANTTGNSFDLGAWTHIVVTNTPTGAGTTGTRKIYVNGTQNHAGTLSGDNDSDFDYAGRIYGRVPQGCPDLSYLNDLAIFKTKALSDAEILSIYNQGAYADLSEYSPEHSFKFNGNGNNSGTSGVNLTLSGTYNFSKDITDIHIKHNSLYVAKSTSTADGQHGVYKLKDLTEKIENINLFSFPGGLGDA